MRKREANKIITELAPALARVAVETKQDQLALQQGSWIQFSNQWLDTWKWAKGNVFTVTDPPIMVDFPMSYIISGGDYIDVNLGNLPTGFSKTALNIYPANEQIVYEIAVGFKKYDFFAQVGIPAANNYMYRLGQSFMYPVITDPILKYLGKKDYKDSPDHAPLLKFYAIKDAPQIYLRLYALEGKNFEKCSVIFQINKCNLTQIATPTTQQRQQATMIRWYDELTKN